MMRFLAGALLGPEVDPYEGRVSHESCHVEADADCCHRHACLCCHGHRAGHGRRCDLPVPCVRPVGERLQESDEDCAKLPADRLRWRHQILARAVTFGASDVPLGASELPAHGRVQLPTIFGAVVNVRGVKAGDLVLDGPTLTSTYRGEITKWNDPRIAKLNRNVSLPATDIAPVSRTDGSRTNFLFASYLSSVSATLRSKVGAQTSVSWPASTGAEGNEGVADTTMQTCGATVYVEYAFAKPNSMAYARLINHDGRIVAPGAATFQAAAANADWKSAPGYNLILTNRPGAASWPIAGASVILIPAKPANPAATAEVLKFLSWPFKNGAEAAKSSTTYRCRPSLSRRSIALGRPMSRGLGPCEGALSARVAEQRPDRVRVSRRHAGACQRRHCAATIHLT